MIDLHMHTSCSDGQFMPEETIRMAWEAGVTTAAVTDHDTTAGVAVAEKAAKHYGLQLFSGIEISTQGAAELHMLGYGIDPDDPKLLAFCRDFQVQRKARAVRMVAYLEQCGAPVTLEEVRQCNDGRCSGRPHFARTLVEKGFADSVQDAFARYLTTPEFYAHVERQKPLPENAIAVIRHAGGVAVLAHPYLLYLEQSQLDVLLTKLQASGLQGIEAYYSRHTPAQTQCYLRLAKQHGLIVTCGSDFHGPAVKPDIAIGTGICGNLCVESREIPEALSKKIAIARKTRGETAKF